MTERSKGTGAADLTPGFGDVADADRVEADLPNTMDRAERARADARVADARVFDVPALPTPPDSHDEEPRFNEARDDCVSPESNHETPHFAEPESEVNRQPPVVEQVRQIGPETAERAPHDAETEALRQHHERELAERDARIRATREEEARRRAEAARMEREREAEEQRLREAQEAEEREAREAFARDNAFGALMAGARATAGKHDVKDVERELRIKARFLTAIEQLDPAELPDEAYLYGYVRTYAAYLQPHLTLSPDEAWEKFKAELFEKTGRMIGEARAESDGADADAATGRSMGLPSAASLAKAKATAAAARLHAQTQQPATRSRDVVLKDPGPARGRALSPAQRIAERAAAAKAQSATAMSAFPERTISPLAGKRRVMLLMVGAMVMLLGVGGAYGVWSALHQAQRVTAPTADHSDAPRIIAARDTGIEPRNVARPSISAYEEGGVLTEIYEPPADAVLRDGPIQSIDPGRGGAYGAQTPRRVTPSDESLVLIERAVESLNVPAPIPAAPAGPSFAVRAIEDSWVRVRNRRGDVLFANNLENGQMLLMPEKGGPFDLRAGNAGGAVVIVNAVAYGPVGRRGQVKSISLMPEQIPSRFAAMPDVTIEIEEEAAGGREANTIDLTPIQAVTEAELEQEAASQPIQ